MIRIDTEVTLEKLRPKLERLWEISAAKIQALANTFDAARGTPVLTVAGIYTSRQWTDWTQGFLYGSALLQYDATGEEWFLEYGKRNTLELDGPAPHAHRRARPRLQHGQYLWKPAASCRGGQNERRARPRRGSTHWR